MGKAEPSVFGEMENSYLHVNREIERTYYEDVLKPGKVIQNLETHMIPDF